MKSIMTIARKRNIQVIEDSCETMFATQDGHSVGGFGDLACFSTYIAHLIVGGVGGIITTDNDALAVLCRSFMAHGRDSIYTNIDQDDSDDDILRRQMIERRFKFDRVGYSYRCTELEAAIALSELERWESNIQTRQGNFTFLTDCLKDLEDKLQLPHIPPETTHSAMMYPIILRCGDRDDFLMYLERSGIETRYLFPLLNQPIYQKLFPGLATKYPVAQHLAKQGFYIGVHQGLSLLDIEYVSDTIHDYFKK
jgi:dTDP-4-amino-4,6-dideoxygalactose transaminase